MALARVPDIDASFRIVELAEAPFERGQFGGHGHGTQRTRSYGRTQFWPGSNARTDRRCGLRLQQRWPWRCSNDNDLNPNVVVGWL
ncbi:MAG: hypothetical protein ACI87E_003980 [Mariniblastus sp.]|jgi:hypothetical protein